MFARSMSKYEAIARSEHERTTRLLEIEAKRGPAPKWAIVVLAASGLTTAAWIYWLLSLVF